MEFQIRSLGTLQVFFLKCVASTGAGGISTGKDNHNSPKVL